MRPAPRKAELGDGDIVLEISLELLDPAMLETTVSLDFEVHEHGRSDAVHHIFPAFGLLAGLHFLAPMEWGPMARAGQ